MSRCALGIVVLFLVGSSLIGCEAAIIRVQETTRGEDAGTGAPVGPGERVTFRARIQRDLESEGCLNCHADGTAPMQLRMSPSTDAEWRANYDEVVARAGRGSSSPLLTKSAGADGHAAALDPGDATYGRWEAWIRDGAPLGETTAPPPPPPISVDGGTTPVDPPPEGSSLTWLADVDALVVRNGCRDCHGDRGSYSLESFDAAMGTGSDDTPNVVPGDPSSLLIQYARDGHHGISYGDALMILAWVVDWDARAE